jgi:hypothetical protein
LITSISTSPDIENIKNDIVVWGEKSSATGDKGIPIHARLAVSKKPTEYRTFPNYERIYLTYLAETEPREGEPLYW